MKFAVSSRYALLGAGLALMLQTTYRFFGPIGVGEVLALAYLGVAAVSGILEPHKLNFSRPNGLISAYIVVVLLAVPMTFLSSAMDVTGSSFRDLLAYVLVAAILVTLPILDRDIKILVITLLIVLFLSILVNFFLGGDSSYYSLRFTGGAKNPNQLALYLVAAVAVSACINGKIIKFIVITFALFFGVFSGSDAFVMFLLVSFIVYICLLLVPPRAALYTVPAVLSLSFFAITYSGISDVLLNRWDVADEGGSRTQLYLSAIEAWLHSPVSTILGHGAGSFSGINGPFEAAEAHNTPLDFATVAGIFGLILFPVLPLSIVLRLLYKNHRFAPAVLMGMIAFAFFHFVGRQPIFWVAMVLVARVAQQGLPADQHRSLQATRGRGVRS